MNHLARACDSFGFTHHHVENRRHAPTSTWRQTWFNVNDKPLTATDYFTSLGSTLCREANIDVEVNNILSKANSALGRLRKVWERPGISQDTKLKIYMVVVVINLRTDSLWWCCPWIHSSVWKQSLMCVVSVRWSGILVGGTHSIIELLYYYRWQCSSNNGLRKSLNLSAWKNWRCNKRATEDWGEQECIMLSGNTKECNSTVPISLYLLYFSWRRQFCTSFTPCCSSKDAHFNVLHPGAPSSSLPRHNFRSRVHVLFPPFLKFIHVCSRLSFSPSILSAAFFGSTTFQLQHVS